jgi:1,4-alpha-glucan branching enzyme
LTKGYLALILHAHLPYVRHPEYAYSLEEKWFFEAITECYIPLLSAFQELEKDGIAFRLTFSLSPTLLAMMEDPFLQDRYGDYLSKQQELAHREEERTGGDPVFFPLARMYRKNLEHVSSFYNEKYGRQLVRPFKELQQGGYLELITSSATHGFLPLLSVQQEAVYAQLAAGIMHFEQVFGTPPKGIWLPECGYDPQFEEIIGELGLHYFIAATHGVLYASPRPKYGVYSPILTPSGTAAFGRDPETSHQVWSAKEGYPGDYNYREFYRDIGFDLDLDYVGKYLHPPGLRSNTGFKYYRITGPDNHKEPYNPQWAANKTWEHAANFIFNREKQVEYYGGLMDRPPIVVAPYDTELFGHWWFEGPLWLKNLCRQISGNQHLEMITPGQYLERGYPLQLSTPNASSWGDKGYYEVWLNGENDWIYRHLHQGARRMIALASDFPNAEGTLRDALTQAARELLLAESSDWPFIMTAGTMDMYARARQTSHMARFLKLERQIRNNSIDTSWLRKLENADNLFPQLDYRLFQPMSETLPVEREKLPAI